MFSFNIYNPWEKLPPTLQQDFLQLVMSIHSSDTHKGRRTLLEELSLIHNCISGNRGNAEALSRLVGICFAGFGICIHTKILSNILRRSKSSINGGLAQLGFVALTDKKTAKQVLIDALPSLMSDSDFSLMWSVRIPCESASVCFVSALPYAISFDSIERKDEEAFSLDF